jgi:hypothetical protein
MKARRPVSTVTDYRQHPPSAGPARTTGAPAGATRGGSVAGKPTATMERPNQADDHDKAVRQLPDQTLLAAAKDLCSRKDLPAPNFRTDEGRETGWILGRKAAALREIQRRNLKP